LSKSGIATFTVTISAKRCKGIFKETWEKRQSAADEKYAYAFFLCSATISLQQRIGNKRSVRNHPVNGCFFAKFPKTTLNPGKIAIVDYREVW
jgi:hypothetical protein